MFLKDPCHYIVMGESSVQKRRLRRMLHQRLQEGWVGWDWKSLY